MKGLLLVNKPPKISSAKFLNPLKQIFNEKHIGHGGTLDFLGEGLLIVGLGKEFTKRLKDFLTQSKKEYVVTIDLSRKSTTYDLEGVVENINLEREITKEEIELAIVKNLLGEQEQIPPLFSARKIKGKRLYEYARENKDVKPVSKKVQLFEFEILAYDPPFLDLRLLVSSGYYVRSFARDLGEILQAGNLVTKLKRTKVGDFDIEDALNYEDFYKKIYLWGCLKGKVHNIGYRHFIMEKAKKFFLNGWVKNVLPDMLEFVLVGEIKTLDLLQKEILNFQLASIKTFDFLIKKPKEILNDFVILPTDTTYISTKLAL